MSLAHLHHVVQPATDELFLGPARVVEMAGSAPLVAIGDREVRAELALAFPYAPTEGDELLVVGKEGRHYVIGVLRARGGVALRFVGDVKLHAVAGKLELTGDQGVQVRGEQVELLATKLRVLADSVMQKATDVYQRVRGTLDVHAGEKRELIEGDLAVRADRASTVTRGTVTINGQQIHLG